MWLAIRILAAIAPVIFEHVNDRGAQPERSGKLTRLDEIEVVCRGVIFRKSSPDATHEASDREVEAWRAILALVIAIG